jgi:hypothetical protein
MEEIITHLGAAVALVEKELEKSAALADLKNQLNTLQDTVTALVEKDAATDVVPAAPLVGSQPEG